jgi:TPR repeat protein
MIRLRLFLSLIFLFFSSLTIAGSHSINSNFEEEFEAAVVNIQEKKYLEAVKGFRALAKEGLPAAQFNLSLLNFSGLGTPKNFKEALYWAWYAHLNGHEIALDQVTQVYEFITEDLRNDVASQIIEELIEAANSGDQMSAFKLGQTYTELLVTPDYQSAYVWLSIAQAYGLEEPSKLLEETAKQLTLEDILVQQNEAADKFLKINP